MKQPVKMDAMATKALVGCFAGFIIAVVVMAVGIYVTGNVPGVPPWITIPLWFVVWVAISFLIPTKTANTISDKEYENATENYKNPGALARAVDYLWGDR